MSGGKIGTIIIRGSYKNVLGEQLTSPLHSVFLYVKWNTVLLSFVEGYEGMT